MNPNFIFQGDVTLTELKVIGIAADHGGYELGFLISNFSGKERHRRRLGKVSELERFRSQKIISVGGGQGNTLPATRLRSSSP
jgi:hypothetical protein